MQWVDLQCVILAFSGHLFFSEQRKKLALSNADISKSVGKRLALFDLETHISPDNSEEEHNAYSNDSFQPDLAKSAHIDLQRFGDKGKLIGQFDDAKDITYVSRGRTLITDLTNSRVQMCNKVGRAVMLYAGDDVAEPWASSITHDGRIAVTSLRKKCVQVMDEDGCIVNTFGNKFFQRPSGIAVDKDGRFIVTDALANRVSIHTSGGKFVTYLGVRDDDKVSFSSPRYVCCSAIGDIIVSDTGNHCVKIFDQYGNFVKSFGEFGSNNKEFKFPYGVCTNQFGDIFVADHYNNRVSLYNSKGTFVRHILTSLHGLIHPQGVAFSPDFTLYVTHGHLKAHEILSIKLTALSDHKDTEIISHV